MKPMGGCGNPRCEICNPPAEVEPRPEAPLYTECVIGYRQWKLADWVLAPVSVGDPWRPGVNTARCQMGTFMARAVKMTVSGMIVGGYYDADVAHAAPDPGCACGLYALHDPLADWFDDGDLVVGAIAAWGSLEVHHNGFRAEHAQILALARGGLELAEVAELYQVPIVAPHELEAEARRHGRPLPASIRPPLPPQPDFGSYLASVVGNTFAVGHSGWLMSTPAPPKVTPHPVKRAANRQGPPRPKRPPRRLGPSGGY